jgi:hypothetical protein
MTFSHDSKKGYFVVLRPKPREWARRLACSDLAVLQSVPPVACQASRNCAFALTCVLALTCWCNHLRRGLITERSNLMIVDLENFHIIKEIQGIIQDMQVRRCAPP